MESKLIIVKRSILATNMNVKRRIGHQFGDPEISARIKALREIKLELDQKAFAALIGVKQPIVSQWESGKHHPSPLALRKIGDVSADDRAWWYERSGAEAGAAGAALKAAVEAAASRELDEAPESVEIKVFRSAGAGSFRSVDETPDHTVAFPRAWLSTAQKLVGLVVEGDSMSPLIETGFIVIVDRTRKTAASALNHIVAASDDGGVAIRWLRERDGVYWLMPHNPNASNAPAPLASSARIIGVVVKWIGQAPTPRK